VIAARAPMVRDITAREYAGFQELVSEASGITLTDSKRQLLVGRVARVVRERGLETYGDYLREIRADDTGDELVRLLDLVATNETRFFRERGHYEYLTGTCYPAWRAAAEAGQRPRTVRAWSAACSTGQEPYSVGMTLLDHLPARDGWKVELLASDISTRALAVAERGEYDVAHAASIPAPCLRRHMRRGVGASEGRMRVAPELRTIVRYRRVNLVSDMSEVPGLFDLIFCSNALIYFSRAGRAQVLERLIGKLAPGGRIFVGHAESLHEHRTLLRAVVPTVYAHASDTTP
jgi:chemotaxis protein methyltransferase CheR